MGIVCCLHRVYCGTVVAEVCDHALLLGADAADRPALKEDGDTGAVVPCGGNVHGDGRIGELIDVDEQFCVCKVDGLPDHLL